MSEPPVELYHDTYKNYKEDLYRAIREETYGEDIGQTSWLTADEYRNIFQLLGLTAGKEVLEVATGSGGPAVFMVRETGCRLTGIDISEDGIANAKELAKENGLGEKMQFILADASERLPFPDESFDAAVSIDSINHLKDRESVLREFFRVLKKGGRLLFTDAVVVTGILSNEEIAARSSLGFFLFVPAGENERLISLAGFRDVQAMDVTGNVCLTASRWRQAREKRKEDLVKFEGQGNYDGLQSFFRTTHQLAAEGRLSRIMYLGLKSLD